MSDLPQGWVETTLGKSIDIYSGKTRPKQQGAYPVYGGNGILNYGDKFNQEGETIIVGRVGAYCGNVFYETQLFWLSDNALGVKAKETSYEKFLYYKLVSMKLNNHAIGGAQPLLTQTLLKELEINLPPLPEQKAIADMLSSFDEKIELLREQNKTLETLAQTIFKEWFVHFNYPDATGEMVDSELGEIPTGWRVGKLGEEFDITIGRTPPRKEQHWFSKTPTGKKWASIKDIVNSGTYLFKTSEYITDEAISKFNIPIIPKNTVILSFKMTVGKLAITTEDMLSNEAIAHMKIKPNSYLISEYIYLFLHGLDFNSLGSTSSIVTAINSTMIKQIQLLVPDEKVTCSFAEVIKPVFEKVKSNSSQIQTLSKTRDTLLPKLMSGQVRVGEVRL